MLYCNGDATFSVAITSIFSVSFQNNNKKKCTAPKLLYIHPCAYITVVYM